MSSGILVSGDSLMIFLEPIFDGILSPLVGNGMSSDCSSLFYYYHFCFIPTIRYCGRLLGFVNVKMFRMRNWGEPRIWWLDSTLILFDTVCLWQMVWFLAFP